FPDAKKYKKISHMEVIRRRLKVMDTTAASLCMENRIPILVLNLTEKGGIKKAVQGKDVGTLVNGDD
ncbi:MAG: UMP kinase, partial [Candidatus Margulisbacteria bacterium]|nr:UMP kinase [Candidatus Margulisiibacteriota bacterium]